MIKSFIRAVLVLFSFIFISGVNADESDLDIFDDLLREEFLRGVNHVPDLARQCKSNWEGQGCDLRDKKRLMSYIVFFCGEIPADTHHVNRGLLEVYIDEPMLNTAFLRNWALLNSDLIWPVCVICFLDYPLDPEWEGNTSFCE